MLLTIHHDICIVLSWCFSASYTANASPLVEAAGPSQPRTSSGRGDAITRAVTFSALIECVLAGQRRILLSAALCCSLPHAGTKSPSLFSAFQAEESWIELPCLRVAFALSLR